MPNFSIQPGGVSSATDQRGCLDISVVVACTDPCSTVGTAVSALSDACADLRAELIIVDGSSEGISARDTEAERGCRVAVIRMPPGTLVPLLWSEGLARASGNAVAFTLSQCVVGPAWARALLAGLENGASGVAGPLTLGARTSISDWAVYYLRYSNLLNQEPGAVASDIPGDNAAYRRASLIRYAATFADGFWEIEFHRRIRQDGETLAFVSGATAALTATSGFLGMMANRLEHGRRFGAWRAANQGRPAWLLVAGSPLVPVLMTARIAARVLRHREHRARLAISLPILFLFTLAWAAGEARGALSRTRQRRLLEAA